MKKLVTAVLTMAMVLGIASCSKKAEETTTTESTTEQTTTTSTTDETTTATEPEGASSQAPEGAITDPEVLSKAITCYTEGDYIYFKIKSSYELVTGKTWFTICDSGLHLTTGDIKQTLYSERCIDEKADKDWFEGIYTCYLEKANIDGIASSDEYASKTWSVLLTDERLSLVLGKWNFVAEGGGKYHFDYTNGWLLGAGEDKKTQEYATPQDKIASWFRFGADEATDDWAIFYFSGFYLEQVDPQGYDKHYMMVCPQGNYSTYKEADEVDVSYCDFSARCPYKFSFEQGGIPDGTYTIVIAQNGGDVEVQFTATKKGNQWTMDFSNATSKYAAA